MEERKTAAKSRKLTFKLRYFYGEDQTHHLGYEKHDPVGHHSGNTRNGASAKTIQGKRGQMQIEVPRDRQSQFEPQIIKKGQRRFDGFDERVISLYARGLSVREIQGHLEEIYGTEVSPDLISTVTGEVLDEVRAWQSRPLDAVSPIVYLDALQVKIRDDGRVANRAISLAIGINLQGRKEVLGMWASPNEGAQFWLSVVTELQNRGVQDIFVAGCPLGGLMVSKAFPKPLKRCSPKRRFSCVWGT